MKKCMLSLLVLVMVFSASQAFADKWQIYFKVQEEVIGQVDGVDIMGYKIGPNDIILQLHQVTNIITVGNYHCVLYLTDSTALASKARAMPEFMGFGYTDMVWRIVFTMSDMNVSDIKHITGAHFFVDGEWHFGSIVDWEAAGSPPDVYFGPLRKILGIPML